MDFIHHNIVKEQTIKIIKHKIIILNFKRKNEKDSVIKRQNQNDSN